MIKCYFPSIKIFLNHHPYIVPHRRFSTPWKRAFSRAWGVFGRSTSKLGRKKFSTTKQHSLGSGDTFSYLYHYQTSIFHWYMAFWRSSINGHFLKRCSFLVRPFFLVRSHIFCKLLFRDWNHGFKTIINPLQRKGKNFPRVSKCIALMLRVQKNSEF